MITGYHAARALEDAIAAHCAHGAMYGLDPLADAMEAQAAVAAGAAPLRAATPLQQHNTNPLREELARAQRSGYKRGLQSGYTRGWYSGVLCGGLFVLGVLALAGTGFLLLGQHAAGTFGG